MKKQDKPPRAQGAFITADEIEVTGTMTNTAHKVKFSKGMGKEATDAHRDTLMNQLAADKEKQDLGLPFQSHISARKIKATNMNNMGVDIEAIETEDKTSLLEQSSSSSLVILPPRDVQLPVTSSLISPLFTASAVNGITYQKITEDIHNVELDYFKLGLKKKASRVALQNTIKEEGQGAYGYIEDSAVMKSGCIVSLSFEYESVAKEVEAILCQTVLQLINAEISSAPFLSAITSTSLSAPHLETGEEREKQNSQKSDKEATRGQVVQRDVHGQVVQIIASQTVYHTGPVVSPLPQEEKTILNKANKPVDHKTVWDKPLSSVLPINQSGALSMPSLSISTLKGVKTMENIIINSPAPAAQQAPSQPLLTMNFINQHEGNLYALFRALVKQGYDWRTLLDHHLFNSGYSEEVQKECEQVVDALVKKRDELDKILYKRAIKLLMNDRGGEEKYQYNRPAKNTGPNKDLTGYKLQYYAWEVVKSVGDKEITLFTVSIQAPGSRDLTSDIDTSIQVECHRTDWVNDAIWPDKFWPELFAPFTQEMDVGAAAEAAIMAYFNQISVEELGLTSAASRDSNVYSKGFLHPEVALKFNPEALIKRDKLKSFEKEGFYIEYKKVTHELELAASLFSLREYYGEDSDKWQQEIIEPLIAEWDGSNNALVMTVLIEQAAKQVEALYELKKAALEKQCQSAAFLAQLAQLQGLDGLNLPFNENQLKQDNKIYALQLVYAQKVFASAALRAEVKRAAKAIEEAEKPWQDSLKKVKESEDKIQRFVRKLKATSDEDEKESYEMMIEKLRKNCILLSQQTQANKHQYSNAVQTFLKAHQQQQEAIVLANLFAHEGYVNYSAVYHTVAWQQSQDSRLKIDRRHVVLCSVLQQIGFRLLHAKQYESQNINRGEILYRTAKYDQRIADMLWGLLEWFKDMPYQAGEPVLSRLKGLQAIHSQAFPEALFPLLERSLKLIKEVKKNNRVPTYQKAYAALLICYRYRIQDFNTPDERLKHEFNAVLADKAKYCQFENWLNRDKTHLLNAAITVFKLAFQSKIMSRSNQEQLVHPEQYGPAKARGWGHLFNSLPVQQKSSSYIVVEQRPVPQ
ncbi:MAG: hypothetical protein K2Q14_03865 [Gammaproteobacteria bacterium]|nr:hypothetical protein [Gammaproteobacteria bacterium]